MTNVFSIQVAYAEVEARNRRNGYSRKHYALHCAKNRDTDLSLFDAFNQSARLLLRMHDGAQRELYYSKKTVVCMRVYDPGHIRGARPGTTKLIGTYSNEVDLVSLYEDLKQSGLFEEI